jgi:hypothetical protein
MKADECIASFLIDAICCHAWQECALEGTWKERMRELNYL